MLLSLGKEVPKATQLVNKWLNREVTRVLGCQVHSHSVRPRGVRAYWGPPQWDANDSDLKEEMYFLTVLGASAQNQGVSRFL